MRDWSSMRIDGIAQIAAVDQAGVEMKDRAVVVKGAAAFVAPGAGHGGDAACGVHVDGAVARAREAVAEAEKGARPFADQAGEGLDGLDRAAGDVRRPLRIARCADARRVRAARRCSVRDNPSRLCRRGTGNASPRRPARRRCRAGSAPADRPASWSSSCRRRRRRSWRRVPCGRGVACVITLTWVFTALVPQITTRSDFAISRGSAPASLPVPAMKPVQAGLTQMVEKKPEYFLAWRRRWMPSRIT